VLEAWSNSPVGLVLSVLRETHLEVAIRKMIQLSQKKASEEAVRPSGTVISHMSRESREYASGYLGAVSPGPAAFELTRAGCGELLSSSLSNIRGTTPIFDAHTRLLAKS